MDSPPRKPENLTRGRTGGSDIRSLDATVQDLFTVSLALATLKVYRTGTNRYLGNPHIKEMSRLEHVTRGVKSLASGSLAQMHHSWCVEKSDRDATMLWAVVIMCFFGFPIAGEVVAPQAQALIQVYVFQ